MNRKGFREELNECLQAWKMLLVMKDSGNSSYQRKIRW